MKTINIMQDGYVSPEVAVIAIDLSQVIAQSPMTGLGNEEFGNEPGDPLEWDNL